MSVLKKKKRRLSFIVWDVPPIVKQGFKTACARKGTTMKKVVVEFMEKFGKAHA